MEFNWEFGQVSDEEEADRLGTIVSQCFNCTENRWLVYRDRIGLENIRVLRQEGEILAGLGIYHMGQWFGSRRVPMAGIAAVGVAPEHRGRGVAAQLMLKTLEELSANGIAISTLYPATQRLYRKVGYEQGGSHCQWELPIRTVTSNQSDLAITPVNPLSPEVFQEIYTQQARNASGHLDRHPAIWQEKIWDLEQEQKVYGYLVGSPKPQGYIIFSQKTQGEEIYLNVIDWVALTAAARNRLWRFVAHHSSIIEKIVWWGSPIEPGLFLLAEQTARIRKIQHWLLRVVNAERALEMRGYPMELDAELHLAVRDNLLSNNNSHFILTVSGGRGEVRRGGKGDLQLDISGLAPLYTGFLTPYQLRSLGQLEATERSLSIATQLFASAPPWMPDFF